jgi:hypothetical protein
MENTVKQGTVKRGNSGHFSTLSLNFRVARFMSLQRRIFQWKLHKKEDKSEISKKKIFLEDKSEDRS